MVKNLKFLTFQEWADFDPTSYLLITYVWVIIKLLFILDDRTTRITSYDN